MEEITKIEISKLKEYKPIEFIPLELEKATEVITNSVVNLASLKTIKFSKESIENGKLK